MSVVFKLYIDRIFLVLIRPALLLPVHRTILIICLQAIHLFLVLHLNFFFYRLSFFHPFVYPKASQVESERKLLRAPTRWVVLKGGEKIYLRFFYHLSFSHPFFYPVVNQNKSENLLFRIPARLVVLRGSAGNPLFGF